MQKQLPKKWVFVFRGILRFSILWMFLAGLASDNITMMVIGTAGVFALTSAFLTQHVRSDRKLKKAFEIVSIPVTLGIIVYGYAITGSVLLGFCTYLSFAIVVFAFVSSYLLPKIRSRHVGYN